MEESTLLPLLYLFRKVSNFSFAYGFVRIVKFILRYYDLEE